MAGLGLEPAVRLRGHARRLCGSAAGIRYAWLSRGQIFGRAGPLLYPLLFELVAYSVTVGNAGTGFRYRSHLVSLGICALAVLRERVRIVRTDVPPGDRQDSEQDFAHRNSNR